MWNSYKTYEFKVCLRWPSRKNYVHANKMCRRKCQPCTVVTATPVVSAAPVVSAVPVVSAATVVSAAPASPVVDAVLLPLLSQLSLEQVGITSSGVRGHLNKVQLLLLLLYWNKGYLDSSLETYRNDSRFISSIMELQAHLPLLDGLMEWIKGYKLHRGAAAV